MRRNTCANVFTNGKVTKVYTLPTTNSLQDFADNVGIPLLIHSDLVAAVKGQRTDFPKLVRHLRTKMKYTESGWSNQNHAAEREIGEFEKRWRRRMFKKQCPRRVWDFGLVYEGSCQGPIISRTPSWGCGRPLHRSLRDRLPRPRIRWHDWCSALPSQLL